MWRALQPWRDLAMATQADVPTTSVWMRRVKRMPKAVGAVCSVTFCVNEVRLASLTLRTPKQPLP